MIDLWRVEFESRTYGGAFWREDYCWAFVILPNGQRLDLGKPRLNRDAWPFRTLPALVDLAITEAMGG